MQFSTLCIHGGYRPDWTGSVTAPLYTSATYAHPGVGRSTGYDYSRVQNPTREQLEKVIGALEGGQEALAFSSGMAAIACLMELFKPGDHLVFSADLYGGTIRLFSSLSKKNGLTFTAVDDPTPENIARALQPNTRALYLETPSNPMMQVLDLAALSALARRHQLLTLVDNTFLTPYFQKPLRAGADIVIHSGTKYLGGHNDVLAGFLIPATPELEEKLRYIYKTTGSCLSPFDSWLILRGLKTLPLRMERHAASSLTIARWLEKQPQVRKVFYPGLESSPGYALSQKQTTGFGGMLSFEVDTEARAKSLLEKVKLIYFAESLGGTETMITYPLLQTHADVPKEECQRKGINERLLRLSVGLEDVEDILADLQQALV
jgi:cystathionine gamma-synthase